MKSKICIIILLISATFLGVYGQDISYFLDENIIEWNAMYYLTAVTYISIFLYFVKILWTYILQRKNVLKGNILNLYWLVTVIPSFLISLWSIFVLAMWWG
ncbi:hypothetical protein BEH_15555 [Priestia filamentosa]|uniref:Uncharacterized protein n=1 Tax=Priestia filamentosa TaxID=1402861 RepID=A0A1X7DKQ8_9BACI|nr:hypothetical protein BEH_15555 [Priestia filamentosa]OXS71978.1 hypothetical protein B1B01_06565 [Priestia filamentosa]SMF16763.1 hypothetical protein SAMN06296056_1011342 [Priestia filamentosa]